VFRVEADKSLNLLKLTFAQYVSSDQMLRETATVAALAAELRPGFRVLSDLSDLESMEAPCLAHIRASMDVLNKRGVSTVVRVIPDPHKDIGLNILSLFH